MAVPKTLSKDSWSLMTTERLGGIRLEPVRDEVAGIGVECQFGSLGGQGRWPEPAQDGQGTKRLPCVSCVTSRFHGKVGVGGG